MPESNTIFSTLIALGSATILYLVAELRVKNTIIEQKDKENRGLANKIDKFASLLMQAVIGMKTRDVEQRTIIADKIIVELEKIYPELEK